MKTPSPSARASALICSIALLILLASSAGAAEDVDALRSELATEKARLAEQTATVEQQLRDLRAQQDRLSALEARLNAALGDEAATGHASATPERLATTNSGTARDASGTAAEQPSIATPTAGAPRATDAYARDDVGDLNAPAIRAGDFPGSFKIPGTSLVSLAIGGFVKNAAIFDSDAEATGANFLAATLGTRRSDEEGAFALDATLARFNVDGRAPVPSGRLRGYLEYDLNQSNDGSLGIRMRHAYGDWEARYGTLVSGHTWSTMMDLKILPEGLTEPTVSGAIFNRQAQLRWSQPLGNHFLYHVALEDPNTDTATEGVASLTTSWPDTVLGIEYQSEGWHIRLNGMTRQLNANVEGLGSDSANAWGVALTGHVDVLDADKIAFSVAGGEGLGRYLLGIQSGTGSAFDPESGSIDLRDNSGALMSYRHQWTPALRSSIMAGFARSKPLDWQPADEFERSEYAAANLMWAVQPYLTLGVEYAFGRNEMDDGTDLSNHRIMFGIQIY